jgi:hypothetical protein
MLVKARMSVIGQLWVPPVEHQVPVRPAAASKRHQAIYRQPARAPPYTTTVLTGAGAREIIAATRWIDIVVG